MVNETINENRRSDPLFTDVIKIFVVDDPSLFRYGLMSVLSEYAEFQVVGDAAGTLEALPKIEEIQPHIVIMDVFMPNSDGIKATALIKQRLPKTEIIILKHLT